eukprot:GDKJ01041998.1.p1 GENE.GDKJ01041998.1~~GDKJ01041998.1.p1  ORF type:complete len:264 (+),score=24.91 GDKJ01041998.1:37-828(+)
MQRFFKFISVNIGYIFSICFFFMYYFRYLPLVSLKYGNGPVDMYAVHGSLRGYVVPLQWRYPMIGLDICAVGSLEFSSKNPCLPHYWKSLGFLSETAILLAVPSPLLICGPKVFQRHIILQRFLLFLCAGFSSVLQGYCVIMLYLGAETFTDFLSDLKSGDWKSVVLLGNLISISTIWVVFDLLVVWSTFFRSHYIAQAKAEKMRNRLFNNQASTSLILKEPASHSTKNNVITVITSSVLVPSSAGGFAKMPKPEGFRRLSEE